ncbi:MAG: hypothetical protein J5532_04555 [Lachnospiraceae bacterium]|nr:hypothetical protein [Lachnospiraceae bacterium]
MAVIKTEKRSTRLIRRLVILALFVAIVAVTLHYMKKKYRIDPEQDVTVTIIGFSERYTEQEIRDHVLSHWYDRYSILVKYIYRYREVETLPFLEKITIRNEEGNKIQITAYEKPPIGCLFDMGYYLYFNRDGEIVSSRKTNAEELPVVTGLVYTNLTMYQKFETQDAKLFDVILNIVFQLEKNSVTIDEIRFGKDKSVTLIMDGNEYRLGVREAYDVQIAMIPEAAQKLTERNKEHGKEMHYDINMERVFTSSDEFYAKVREESADPDGGSDDNAPK